MEKIREGTVVFVYHEDFQYYPTDDPQIVVHVNDKNSNSILYETKSFNGISVSKNLEPTDIQEATANHIPEEYQNIINKEYVELSAVSKADLYEATGIQVMNGKDLVESCYDEWSGFFYETYEFSGYMESLGLALDEVKLDNVYAGDIVNGQIQPIHKIEELEQLIEEKLKPNFREGNASEYRSSPEYFKSLAEEVGNSRESELKEPIVEIVNCPENPDLEGYHTERDYLRSYNLGEYSDNNFLEHTKVNVYNTYSEVPLHQGLTGKEYLALHKQKELNKTPFFKEHGSKENVLGTGFYYSDLLNHYHKENPENTKLKEGQSFNEGESTTILDTGKYSYEYDHAVRSLDKINNEKGYIEKSYEVDKTPETKREIEKDISSEIEKEPEREHKRQEALKRQKEEMLRKRGLER